MSAECVRDPVCVCVCTEDVGVCVVCAVTAQRRSSTNHVHVRLSRITVFQETAPLRDDECAGGDFWMKDNGTKQQSNTSNEVSEVSVLVFLRLHSLGVTLTSKQMVHSLVARLT